MCPFQLLRQVTMMTPEEEISLFIPPSAEILPVHGPDMGKKYAYAYQRMTVMAEEGSHFHEQDPLCLSTFGQRQDIDVTVELIFPK